MKIYLIDFIKGIIYFPIFCIGSVPYDLISILLKPFYLSYLQMKGVNVIHEIDPNMSLFQLFEYRKRMKK